SCGERRFFSQSLRRFKKVVLTCRIKPKLPEKPSPLSVSQSSRKVRISNMEKRALFAALFLSLSILPAYATPQDGAFQKIAHDYIEQYLRANPEDATELGDHRFDGQLTDYSSERRGEEVQAPQT